MTSVRNIVCGLVICSFASFGVQSALAEDMSKDQMVKSLKAKPSFRLQERAAEKAARERAVEQRAIGSVRLLAITSSICA
jgi:hypothetical protein